MLKTRFITAIILLPLLILIILFLPARLFSIVAGLFILLGAFEWSVLSGIQNNIVKVFYTIIVALGLLLSAWIPILIIFSLALGFWIWIAFAIFVYEKNKQGNHAVGFQFRFVRIVSGFFIFIATWTSWIFLKSEATLGPKWLIYIIMIIVSADVGAYFSGRFFGKKYLSPRVSPKKTWEGFYGGMILACLVAVIGNLFFNLSVLQHACFIILSIVCALFSVIGDLGVSLLKRFSGVKDAGRIFPGHGGMLDRLDSVAAATVIFALGILLCNL